MSQSPIDPRDVSERVARFLADFEDDLNSEFTDGRVVNGSMVRDIVVATAPVVMALAMKGNL